MNGSTYYENSFKLSIPYVESLVVTVIVATVLIQTKNNKIKINDHKLRY